MLAPTTIFVLLLAVYRTTRIVTHDSISLTFRSALYNWAWVDPTSPDYQAYFSAGRAQMLDGVAQPALRGGSWRTYVYTLLTCPLCLGVWVSAASYVLWTQCSWSHSAMYILAVAGGQTFIQTRDDA